jgi:hypothetical protein
MEAKIPMMQQKKAVFLVALPPPPIIAPRLRTHESTNAGADELYQGLILNTADLVALDYPAGHSVRLLLALEDRKRVTALCSWSTPRTYH